MPKKKTAAPREPSPRELIQKRQFANIVAKVRDGKSLTTTEQKFLDGYDDNAQETKSVIDEEAIIRTSDLVDFLGISSARISELAKDQIAVKKTHGRYYAARTIRNYIRMLQKGRKSAHGSSATMEELRQRLIDEQGRKEAAIASLRELELRMKAESLVPETELIETLMKTLTPLRRLLDALPRQTAQMANPENPNIAELAIRNSLDERVFLEIQKILLENKIETDVDNKT
jgi:phage terminase Nu1 subunit (DNA packaging protein)